MKKIIIEILRLSFYISSLIFFDNNIIVTSISLLLILYSYDLRRMLIPCVILILFVALSQNLLKLKGDCKLSGLST